MHFKWSVQCLLMREHESYDVTNVITFPFHITLKFSCASYASGQIRVSSFFFVSRASFFTFSLSSKSTQNYGHGQCPDPQILSLRHKNNLLSRRKDQIKKLKYPVTLNACKVIFQLVLKYFSDKRLLISNGFVFQLQLNIHLVTKTFMALQNFSI